MDTTLRPSDDPPGSLRLRQRLGPKKVPFRQETVLEPPRTPPERRQSVLGRGGGVRVETRDNTQFLGLVMKASKANI